MLCDSLRDMLFLKSRYLTIPSY